MTVAVASAESTTTCPGNCRLFSGNFSAQIIDFLPFHKVICYSCVDCTPDLFSKIEIYHKKYPTQNNYNQENEEPSGVWIFLKDAGKWKRTEKLLILYIYMNVIRIICILAHLPIINSKSKEIILGVRTTWEINLNLSSATTSQFLAPLPFQMYMPETIVILEFFLSLQPTLNPLRGYAFKIDPISDHA